jgi:hypothetical protein
MGWTCSHQKGTFCDLLNIECTPGAKGCTLYGKAVFADPTTPSNEAVARREEMRKKREKEEMEALMKQAKRGF